MTADNRYIARYIRSKFDYSPATGRLKRVAKGRGARVGLDVGYIEAKSGYRRIYVCGRLRQASAVVWAWHNGVLPEEDLVHINGDFADDRIENLAKRSSLRRPVQVAMALAPDEQPETMLGDLQGALNTGIYQITNIKNGRRYVGSAVNISKRWREHLRQLEAGNHHSRFMQRCWDKHGGECFVFRVLICCSVESLLWYEQRALDALRPEYNSAPKAGSKLGYKHSAESRKKMSASRPKDFSPMTGKSHSEETKRRISKAKTGVKQCPEAVARRAASLRALNGRHSAKKFTEAQILEIRSRADAGEKNIALAREFGVADSVICEIKKRRAYRWVADGQQVVGGIDS